MSNKRGGPLSPEQRERKQQRFLKAYRETGNITYACKSASVSRQTYYDWRDHDSAFAEQLPNAEEEANDTLEMAAYERAVRGVPSTVVSLGRIVYEEIPVLDDDGNPKLNKRGEPIYMRGKALVERKYSDSLLITLLKARMPAKYNNHDVSATITATGEIALYLPQKQSLKEGNASESEA